MVHSIDYYKEFTIDTVFVLGEMIFNTIVYHDHDYIQINGDNGKVDFVDRIPEGLIDFRKELNRHIERVKNAIDRKLECIPKNYPDNEDLN